MHLVRLGILKGSGPKLFVAARFQEEYRLLSPREITALHTRLVTLFRSLPHGPFQALSEMVGERQAKVLAGSTYRECALLDSHQNPGVAESSRAESSRARPNKRTRLDHGGHNRIVVEISD